jgi:maltose operon protein
MHPRHTIAVWVLGWAAVSATTAPSDLHAVTSLTDLVWQDLALPATHRFEINAASQVLDMQGRSQPVAAFRVPLDGRTIAIETISYVGKTSLLPPKILILDERLAPLGTSSSDTFELHGKRLLQPDRLIGDLEVTPPTGDKHLHLIVHARAEALGGATTVRHPAKAYADALQQTPLNIPDPVVQHGPYGSLRIRIQGKGPTPITKQTAMPPASTPLPQAKAAPRVASLNDPLRPPKGKPTTVRPRTQAYFETAIREAVTSDDLEQAMELLNEAEHLGVPDARATFIDAVHQRRQKSE